MFGQQQPQQTQKSMDFNQFTNIFYLAVASYGSCVTVFLRHSFGSKSFGLHFLGAFLINYLYVGMYPRHPLIQIYFLLWIAVTILQRIRASALTRSGKVHSKSAGYPWVGYLLPWIRTYSGAVVMEAAVCFFGGVFMMPYDEEFGAFIVFAGVAAALKHGLEADIDTARLTRMRDAEIEQRHLLDRYRRGDF